MDGFAAEKRAALLITELDILQLVQRGENHFKLGAQSIVRTDEFKLAHIGGEAFTAEGNLAVIVQLGVNRAENGKLACAELFAEGQGLKLRQILEKLKCSPVIGAVKRGKIKTFYGVIDHAAVRKCNGIDKLNVAVLLPPLHYLVKIAAAAEVSGFQHGQSVQKRGLALVYNNSNTVCFGVNFTVCKLYLLSASAEEKHTKEKAEAKQVFFHVYISL